MGKLKTCALIVVMALTQWGCKKKIMLSDHSNEVFWVTNKGADMPVWVKGNTASHILIILIHGGPGAGAYSFSDYETQRLQQKYGVAFWDQRDAGASAGNNNYRSLSLDQMVNDLEAVIKSIRYRYPDFSVFLYSHSFGGLLGAAYLVKDLNQLNNKAWINIDGAHNYPLSNSLSRQMLIDTGSIEIGRGHNVSQWQAIVDYCQKNDPIASFKASTQIETYAHTAEGLMGVSPTQTRTNLFSPEDPSALLTNIYKMYYTSSGDHFIESLQNANYSDQLYKLKIPCLLVWGQYDFSVPQGVGQNAFNNLGSTYKKLIIIPNSGHRPMLQAPNIIEDQIIEFIEKFK
ncbi:MAG: alpha/beta hydrolase [Flavisolibacter sp.]